MDDSYKYIPPSATFANADLEMVKEEIETEEHPEMSNPPIYFIVLWGIWFHRF